MASNATSLVFKHIFGINGAVTDNVSYVDDDQIAYIAGHSMVLYNRIEKKQRFIYGAEMSEGITAFAISPAKRFAAVAERGERAQVYVYDLRTFRKRKTLVNSDTSSREYICMQFSEDNQYLLTLSGAPDYTLICWNWSKAKALATAHASSGSPMTRCSFSPIDASMSCVTGKDSVKFFRITERDLRPVHDVQLEGHNFTCHCWLRQPEDHLVAGTDNGDLVLFRAGEYICHLACSPGPEKTIFSLLPIPQGVIAGSKNGLFLFFSLNPGESDKSPNKFVLEHSWSSECASGNIVSLALSLSEDMMCAVTSENQLVHVAIGTPNAVQNDHVKYLLCSFHGPKAIMGMDVCIRKPTIITVAKDNTLRIWNYNTMDLEMIKHFPEEMLCVALHPSGLHVAVGFADKLRVFHVLVDELRPCLEIAIKNCRECRFANGGNLLAAANGNSINVFDFYSGEKIADLRGHNGKVRGMFWMESGSQLLSCGQDGAVYLWDLEGCKRTGEFVHKGTMYTSTVSSGDCVFVVGSDRMLKELELPDLTVAKELDGGTVLTHVALAASKSVLLAGTGESGKPSAVRAYSFPVTGDYLEYPCMGSPISRLRVTPDEGFLIATDESGCVCVFELKDRQERFQRSGAVTETVVIHDWTDEVLVTRAELEDRHGLVAELTTKVEELKLHNEYQMKLKEMGYSEKIKEVTDKYAQELEQAKTKHELLREERDDSELEYIEKLKQMEEKHQHDLQEVETEFQAQIMEEVEKYQQLVRDRDAQHARLEDQRRTLVATHERYVEELTNDFERRLVEDKQLRSQLQEERAEAMRELEETHRQLEDDVDSEIENLRRTYEDKLTSCREATLKYKGENGIMRKKFIVLQKDIEDQKEEVRALQDREKELHDQIKVLEKEVSAHKREIKVRDTSIGDKEKRIYELKKKNQELDKFKFVLDYKIRELKRQIEPRQMEILAMKDQIKAMDAELEKYHKTNAALDNMIGSLRQRIDTMQEQAVTRRMRAKQLEHTVAQTKSGMHQAVTLIQNPPKLRDAVEQLVKTHGALGVYKPQVDTEVENEYSRHREYLERSMHQLQVSLQVDLAKHQSSNRVLMEDNMALIAEINAQRDANRALRQRVQADVGRLQHLARSSVKKTSANSLADLSFPQDSASLPPAAPDHSAADPTAALENNRQYIKALRTKVIELGGRVVQQRSYSREVLPPMDGVRDMGDNADSNRALFNPVK
eukprot:gene3461-6887_t